MAVPQWIYRFYTLLPRVKLRMSRREILNLRNETKTMSDNIILEDARFPDPFILTLRASIG